MAFLLLFEPPLQRLHQLVPATERFNLGLLFVRQGALTETPQPVVGNARREAIEDFFGAFEMRRKSAIESIEVALVFHQARARQVIELFRTSIGELGLQSFQQCQKFRDRDWNARIAQFEEEGNQHGTDNWVASQ